MTHDVRAAVRDAEGGAAPDTAAPDTAATDTAATDTAATDTAATDTAATDTAATDTAARAAVRELVENWALWRDAGEWERFRTVWHDDGRMMATWFQGPVDEFVAVSRRGFDAGVRIAHFLGGSTVDVRGPRAVGQTKMTITQRAEVHGIACDVVCTGRFYDLLEERDERWGLVLRQPIYEQDRLDPVTPGAVPDLDPAVLAEYPEGYRHLAYLQRHLGFTVKPDMPQLTGPAVQRLYALGREWLAGEAIRW